MTFTSAERRLLMLYYSGTAADTADTLRHALRDITDPDECADVVCLLEKICVIDRDSVALDALDWGDFYG